jgi:hypothetical protein
MKMSELNVLPDHINRLSSDGVTIYLLHSTPIVVIIDSVVNILDSLESDEVHLKIILEDIGRCADKFLGHTRFMKLFKLAQSVFPEIKEII